MQTVVCDNAAKAVAGYVSYMKRSGFNQNQVVNSKNAMLNFLRRFINKEIAEKKDDKPEWRTCYWSDGHTPMTWCFTLYLLPQQKIVAIMAFTCKENKPGVKENRRVVRLTESKIRKIVEESVKKVLQEMEEYNPYRYKPIGSHKFWSNNGKTEWKSIVTLQEPASGQCCHIVEDDHCYVLFNGSGLKDKNCEHIHYIFPEAFEALKALPPL